MYTELAIRCRGTPLDGGLRAPCLAVFAANAGNECLNTLMCMMAQDSTAAHLGCFLLATSPCLPFPQGKWMVRIFLPRALYVLLFMCPALSFVPRRSSVQWHADGSRSPRNAVAHW